MAGSPSRKCRSSSTGGLPASLKPCAISMPSRSDATISPHRRKPRSEPSMNKAETTRKFFREAMRIGGKKIEADDVVPVHYPYTNEVIGTVPAGRAEHAAQAFAIAAGFKPRLTRYERQQILFRAGELIKA